MAPELIPDERPDAPTSGLRGSLARTVLAPSSPMPEGRLHGKMLGEASRKERRARLETWHAVLVPGQYTVMEDPETGRLAAHNSTLERSADVTELFTPGAPIARCHRVGEDGFSVQGTFPFQEWVLTRGETPRFKIDIGDGTMGISLSALGSQPDERGRSWQLPVPPLD